MKSTFDRALEKAKIDIMFGGSVFLTTIAFNLHHKEDSSIPTACVDGITIKYNPDFFLSLNSKLRTSLIIHETWHVALSHMVRKGVRDHRIYNEAGDYVINQLIVDEDRPIGDGWLYNPKYKGMSTEQIYDILHKNKEENKEETLSTNPLAGDVREASESTSTEIKSTIDRIILQAHTVSDMAKQDCGNSSAEMQRYIEDLRNPKLPWESILHQFISTNVQEDYSWSKPNKKYMPEFILPSLYSEAIESLTFAVDTSGSISNEVLRKILSEIEYIKDVFNPKKLTIIDCSNKIHGIHELSADESVLDIEFVGKGGTACKPVFDYCDKEDTKVLIYFTDLYMKLPTEELGYPLLWVVYDNPKAVASIGEIAFIDI